MVSAELSEFDLQSVLAWLSPLSISKMSDKRAINLAETQTWTPLPGGHTIFTFLACNISFVGLLPCRLSLISWSKSLMAGTSLWMEHMIPGQHKDNTRFSICLWSDLYSVLLIMIIALCAFNLHVECIASEKTVLNFQENTGWTYQSFAPGDAALCLRFSKFSKNIALWLEYSSCGMHTFPSVSCTSS